MRKDNIFIMIKEKIQVANTRYFDIKQRALGKLIKI